VTVNESFTWFQYLATSGLKEVNCFIRPDLVLEHEVMHLVPEPGTEGFPSMSIMSNFDPR